MSEFKKAGFTDKTLFRVVDNRPARDGRIVWISSDDGTGAPFFSDLVDDSQCYSFESFLEELPRDQDGFYLWEGEAQPVPDDWVVDVRCRGGETGEGPASGWYWPVDGTPIDITAFRVISTGQAAPEWPEPEEDVPLSDEGGLVFEMPTYIDSGEEPPRRTAELFLAQAAELMAERGKDYDKPNGERSTGKAVHAFNAITGRDLTEAEGWLFMSLVKRVRQYGSPSYHKDSAEDAVAYAALEAEALERGD